MGGGHGLLRRQPARVLDRRCAADRLGAAPHVELCGVFVNAPLDEVVQASEQLELTMLQLHGDEGPSYCAEVGHRTGAR